MSHALVPFSHQHRSNPHRVISVSCRVNLYILRHCTPANLLPHIWRVRGSGVVCPGHVRLINVVWIIYGATHGTAPLYVCLYLLPGLVRWGTKWHCLELHFTHILHQQGAWRPIKFLTVQHMHLETIVLALYSFIKWAGMYVRILILQLRGWWLSTHNYIIIRGH